MRFICFDVKYFSFTVFGFVLENLFASVKRKKKKIQLQKKKKKDLQKAKKHRFAEPKKKKKIQICMTQVEIYRIFV